MLQTRYKWKTRVLRNSLNDESVFGGKMVKPMVHLMIKISIIQLGSILVYFLRSRIIQFKIFKIYLMKTFPTPKTKNPPKKIKSDRETFLCHIQYIVIYYICISILLLLWKIFTCQYKLEIMWLYAVTEATARKTDPLMSECLL